MSFYHILFFHTSQSLQTINILCEIFQQLFFILKNFQKIMRRVWQIILSREEFFCPGVEWSRILSYGSDLIFYQDKLKELIPEIVDLEDGLRVRKVVFLEVGVYSCAGRPEVWDTTGCAETCSSHHHDVLRLINHLSYLLNILVDVLEVASEIISALNSWNVSPETELQHSEIFSDNEQLGLAHN